MPAEGAHVKPGDLIDSRYRIVEQLGQGGMGQVFKAEHIGIKRPVALKLLHASLRDQAQVNERIMREAFATGRLDHPNCVSITDSGALEDGTTYLVMELLKGQSLGDEIDDRGSLPVLEALEITRQLLSGLGHAHNAGVVHRDLKPENIFLVQPEDGERLVKILDFGIAKLLGDAREQEGGTELTEAGMAIGSPTYMSPEQATGAELDGRTDLYSMSLVLYEMLVGEPPFYEPEDKLRSLQRRLKEDPPVMKSPSGASIPPGVELMIREGLARNPEDRIASAHAYALRVDALLGEMRAVGSGQRVRDNQAPVVPDTVRDQAPGWIPAPVTGYGPLVSSPPPAGPATLTPAQKKILAIGLGGVLVLVVLIAALAGSGRDEDKASASDEPSLVMRPDPLNDTFNEDSQVARSRLETEILRLQREIDAERGPAQIKSLQKLASVWPDDARINYLLGMAFMQKRYWQDGFKSLRRAMELEPELRSDEALIKAALRSLSSRSKPGLGVTFLVDDVGAFAIPLLQETARDGSTRQREYANKALQRLESSPL